MKQLYGFIPGNRLNLRQAPDQSSPRLTLIPSRTLLILQEHNEAWYKTTYGAFSGYVMKKFITLLDFASAAERAIVTTGNPLNLRRSPSTEADCLAHIPCGTQLTVLDMDAYSAWYCATFEGYTGYIMKKFATLPQESVAAPDAPPASLISPGELVYVRVTSTSLNVRKEPNQAAARWNAPWPINRIAVAKALDTAWYETTYRGEPAFISAGYVQPLADPVPDDIVQRMLFVAKPELGRNNVRYFNGYTGAWCHRFADWLTMHAGQPKNKIPNTSNCGLGIVWFVNNAESGGFFFKNAQHKQRMIKAYRQINHLSNDLTEIEQRYVPTPGDYIYFRWSGADKGTNVSHVGIVDSVTDGEIKTWEGNASAKVANRTYALTDPRIVGYGHPLYKTKNEPAQKITDF